MEILQKKMYQNVRVVDVKLNSILNNIFPGPKFGINGIRKIIHGNSILCPVFKTTRSFF